VAPADGVDHGRGYSHRAPFGDNDAMNAYYLGRAQQRAEVLRVLEAIQHQQQRHFLALIGLGQNLF